MITREAFYIKASKNILPMIYFAIRRFPDDIELSGNELCFTVREVHDAVIMNYIEQLSILYPSEIIHIVFTPELPDWCKMEHYELRNGHFISKGITLRNGVRCEDSASELLSFKRKQRRLEFQRFAMSEISKLVSIQ